MRGWLKLGEHVPPRGRWAELAREVGCMASAPQGLKLRPIETARTGGSQVWLRRALLLLPGAIVALGLLNTFGQRPATTVAAGTRRGAHRLRADAVLGAGLSMPHVFVSRPPVN